MITIYDSASKRTTSTTQDLLNDMVYESGYPGSEWYNVVEESGNISEIWISSKIYLSKSSDSTPKLKISHVNGISTSFGATPQRFITVVTDNGMFVSFESTYAVWLAIGKTTDLQDAVSHGVFFKSANSSVYRVYSDNITTVDMTYSGGAIEKSAINTVFVPLYSITGNEHFNDIMFVLASKSTDSGQVLLNDQKYYIYEGVALPYT